MHGPKERRLERPNLHRKGASWGMRGRCDRCSGDLRASYRLRLTRWWVGVRTRIWRRGCKIEGGKGIAPADTLLPQLVLHGKTGGMGCHCEPVRRLAQQSVSPALPPQADTIRPYERIRGRARRGGLWPPAGDLPGRRNGTGCGGAGAPRPTEGPRTCSICPCGSRGNGPGKPGPYGMVPGNMRGADTIRPTLTAKDEGTDCRASVRTGPQ